jgi:predicted hydrocarbon binding protein
LAPRFRQKALRQAAGDSGRQAGRRHAERDSPPVGGYDCAANYSVLRKHKGDVDGFIREFKERTNEDITYDREKGIVTVVSPERTECTCPLIAKNLTSSKVCNCSLGWQQCTYETLLGKKVQVELTESILRGGKRCRFQIQVLA